jgi:hypothetical protein
MRLATDKNPTIDLDANVYFSRILFAQRSDANSWGSEKRHKRRRDQCTNFCSGANMDAPLTALEEQKKTALKYAGVVGFLHRY